jgi:uncharacterized protein with von Willebrand factor type A (vWA) domain
MPIGVLQTLAAVEAAETVGVADQQRFSYALRAALCSSQMEWKAFDRLFDAFWSKNKGGFDSVKDQSRSTAITPQQSSNAQVLIGLEGSDASPADNEGKLVAGASAQQRLKKVDFSEVSGADLVALEQLSLRLLRRMSIRLSRRLKIDSQGERVDIRRSIRRNVTRGGELLALAYKNRKPQKKRLVILLDVSGSMNLYSLFLLRFAYAIEQHFKRVDTFLFSTGVVEVTDLLRTPNLSEALRKLSQRVPEWAGGTKIGGSLHEFNRRAARKLSSRTCYLIILSDGWDTGPPETLAAELRSARSRVQKLIWLNPLLGLKDYQPVTRAMSAALAYVDVFAPAHNMESLLALEGYF